MFLKNISISSLNCNNLKANFSYCKFLVENSSICYLSELWTKKNEYHLIQNLRDNHDNKINPPLYQSDMQNCQMKGRPFGGQCWFLDELL